MSNEMFDIRSVKDEFLAGVIEEYTKVYSQMQLEAMVSMLAHFTEQVHGSGLVLLRYSQVQQMQPQQQMQMPQTQGQDPFAAQQEMQMRAREQARMELESQTAREVAEMNAQMSKANSQVTQKMQVREKVQADLSSESEKPSGFVDRVRHMRMPQRKDKINPDSD